MLVVPHAERRREAFPAARAGASFIGVGISIIKRGVQVLRVELQVVYGTLYRRVPTLRLAVAPDELEFAFEGIAYSLRSLPVTW